MTPTRELPHVGAPDPEQKTSPIFDQSGEDFMSPDLELESGACYFNNETFAIGDYVCSFNELLRCEAKGIWVREGTCYQEEAE